MVNETATIKVHPGGVFIPWKVLAERGLCRSAIERGFDSHRSLILAAQEIMSQLVTEKNHRLVLRLWRAMLAIRKASEPSHAQTGRFLRIRDALCETPEGCELFRAMCPEP